MRLETMRPDPAWDPTAHEATVATLRDQADELTIRVWCGDWCVDCRSLLPDFAAALAAADIDPETVEQYPVEKADDGSKVGPNVTAYGIERIPTIIVERDGEEIARFVEEADRPPAAFLATALAAHE